MRVHEFLSQQNRLSVVRQSTLAEASVLTIPGWNGSSAGHWQTIWEQKYPHFRRVEQSNWARPSRADWVARLDADLERMESPTFLVAHSLGCLAVAHWAATAGKKADFVDGALLVAPPWLTESDLYPRQLADFFPMPMKRLPFPSLLVASEDDNYLPIENAAQLASAWVSQFVNVGRQGHINIASGHGPWPTGEELLFGLVARNSQDF